jgi:hypothetical protein
MSVGRKLWHCLSGSVRRLIRMGGITDTGISEGVQWQQGENDDPSARGGFDEDVDDAKIPV